LLLLLKKSIACSGVKFLTIILLFISSSLLGQQREFFSYYTEDLSTINPAGTGISERHIVNLYNQINAQNTYIGYTSTYFSWNTPFRFQRYGVGLVVNTNEINTINRTKLSIPLSYKIKALKGKISIGISNSISYKYINTQAYNVHDNSDIEYENFISNKALYSYSFDFGALYYTEKIEAGIAINDVINFDNSITKKYNAHASYTLALRKDLHTEFATIYKNSSYINYLSGLTIFSYKDAIYFGGGYRTNNDYLFIFGITNKLLQQNSQNNYKIMYINNGNIQASHNIFYPIHEIGLQVTFGFEESLRNIQNRIPIQEPLQF